MPKVPENENEVVFRCSCHGSHFVSLRFWPEDEKPDWAHLDVSSDYRALGSWWSRLKVAWQVLRGGCGYSGPEAYLEKEDARALADWLRVRFEL